MARNNPLALARVRLLLALALAYVASGIRPLARFLDWFVTYFHEMSHGVVSLVTGGDVVRMVLNLDGSGYVLARGGLTFVSLFAGYAGSFACGALIARLALTGKGHHNRPIAAGLAVLILTTGLGWAYLTDISTWIILILLALSFGWFAWQPDADAARIFLSFIGAYILVRGMGQALLLHAWTGSLERTSQNHSDAGALAVLTGVPALVFTAAWIVCGCLAIAYVWHVAARLDQRKRLIPAAAE